MAERPIPVLPAFDGPCLANVVGPLIDQAHGRGSVPAWMPAGIEGARQVVLLVLDGLGALQLGARAALAPTLSGASTKTITSVAPSTTACALTSLVTGRAPADHGILGYRVHVGGQIMNVLGWRLGDRDARMLLRAREFQPQPPFPNSEDPVPVVTRWDYASTGFTAAHLGGSTMHGWHTPAGLVVEVGRLLRAGAPFVYAYYDGIDKIAHAQGLGDHYDAELRSVDRLVGDMLDELVPGAVLVITADHGQIDVGPAIEVLGPEIMDAITLISGEGRFRWLHAKPGAERDVLDASMSSFGHLAWVKPRDELVADGWLGGTPGAGVIDRLGSVALVPFAPVAFLDPSDTGELRLAGRHGSLTTDEMMVPLLCLGAA